jgi:hypothetical protein
LLVVLTVTLLFVDDTGAFLVVSTTVEEEAAMRSGDDRELLTWSEIGEQEILR